MSQMAGEAVERKMQTPSVGCRCKQYKTRSGIERIVSDWCNGRIAPNLPPNESLSVLKLFIGVRIAGNPRISSV